MREYKRTNKKRRDIDSINSESTTTTRRRKSPLSSTAPLVYLLPDKQTECSYHYLKAVVTEIKSGRFVTDTELRKHVACISRKKGKTNTRSCYMCGTATYFDCQLCQDLSKQVPLCLDTQRRKDKDGNVIRKYCYLDYHNYQYFGLAKGDCLKISSEREWRMWTDIELIHNTQYMNYILQIIQTNNVAISAAATTFTTTQTPTPNTVG